MTLLGIVILTLLLIWNVWFGVTEYRKGTLRQWLVKEWKHNIFIVLAAVVVLILISSYFGR